MRTVRPRVARLVYLAALFGLLALLWTPQRSFADISETVSHSSSAASDVWQIQAPVVTKRETVYNAGDRNIRYASGDIITVQAGGCVQTGGSGDTWKRYVDPSGPNSDRLYHGLISLPGVTPGLVRIAGWLNRPLVVPQGLDPAGLYLHLGYEDDDYSDNGYYSHDDGTQNQCKNVGPASVTLTIAHNAPTPPPAAQPPMNLVQSSFDNNFIGLNPQWAWRLTNPDPPDTNQLCAGFPFSNNTVSFGTPPCTTQAPSVDTPSGFNGGICAIGGDSGRLNGHLNLGVATYTGQAIWDGHSAPGTDDDYNINLITPDKAGAVTGADRLHTEFDSDETIDHFDSPWWNALHAVADNDPAAGVLVNNQDAIVTGLLGLDCEHGCSAELHPVWAMAIRVKNVAADETWAMFVRNWGDEGYCSQYQHYLDLEGGRFTFRLPWRPGATGVTMTGDSQFRASSGSIAGPDVTFVNNQAALVTFTLPAPESNGMVHGELHLNWSGGSAAATGAGALSVAPAAPAQAEVNPESMVAAMIAALNPGQRALLNASLPARAAKPDPLAAPGHAPQYVSVMPAVIRVPPRVRVGPAPAKALRDSVNAQALRIAYAEQIPGLPPQGPVRQFAPTGQSVASPFLDYWSRNGALPQQGYPISTRFAEVSPTNGQTYAMQYFERAVFEYHPENAGTPYQVLLSLLGALRYQAKYGAAGAPGQRVSTENPRYFPETKHTVGGKFRAYWEQHGGLAQQGYPVSDEFTEVSDLNGKPYTVQYFQRAVFELHPENAGTPYEVLLSQLGTFEYHRRHP
jgi:hypothetical protein